MNDLIKEDNIETMIYKIRGKQVKSKSNINNKLTEHDDKLKYIFDRFEYKGELIKINKLLEAYSSITDIINPCQNELIIIDPYADKKILDLINNLTISIILITSDKSKLNDRLLNSFNKEHTFKIIYNNSFHDRYIILDKKEIYLCGTSINYIGNEISTITKFDNRNRISKYNLTLCYKYHIMLHVW